MTTTKRLTAISTLSVALLGLGGCKAAEPYNDAPAGRQVTGPADVINMPDGFSNAAAKCDGPNRIYVEFAGPNRPTRMRIGERVVGAVRPDRSGDRQIGLSLLDGEAA